MERHRTDVVSLVFGVLFVAVGAIVLLDSHILRTLWTWRIWPVIPILLGLWLLAATARRSSISDAEPTDDEPEAADDDRDSLLRE